MSNAETGNTVALGGGATHYALEDAAAPIADVIAALEDAQADGAEYVVGLTGNHRGARWSSITDSWEWVD